MTPPRRHDAAETEAPAWMLRQAMEAVLALSPGNVLRSGNEAIDRQRVMRGDSRPDTRWPGGLHCHPYPELCIPLTDGAAMDVDAARYRFHPPAMAILEPQVVHCEAFVKKASTYQVMWMSFSGSQVLAMTSRYRPRRGWDVPWRSAIQHTTGRQIYRLLTERDPQCAQLEPLQAELLILLAELLKRSLYLPAGQAVSRSRVDKHLQLLEGVKAFIDHHLESDVSVAMLAGSTGLTPNYLNALFRQWTGEAIHLYITRRRMELAMELCKQGDLLIKQIALRSGYGDPLYFSRAFRRFHGVSPTDIRVQR